MVFPSVSFVIFFLCTCLLLSLAPQGRSRILILAAANLLFFIFTPTSYILIAYLLAVQASQYLFLQRFNAPRWRFWITASHLMMTLVPLFWTKYALSLALFFKQDVALQEFLYQGVIPVGTSFLTFSSLMVLLYRHANPPTPSPPHSRVLHRIGSIAHHLAAFLFFPITASGPLMPTRALTHQLDRLHVRLDPLALWYIAQGLFLKLIVSSYAAQGADVFFNQLYEQNIWSLWFASILYSAQIYADFAGYSLMALGCASLLGIRIWRNFHSPYLSTSLSQFWRRWHMSLAHFWRRYIYIPLGGSKRSALRTYLNLFIVMFVCGIWHGAGFGFLLWGLFHGLYLALERLYQVRTGNAFGSSTHICWAPLRQFRSLLFGSFTFLMVSALWLLFRLPEWDQLAIVVTQYNAATPWHLIFTSTSAIALLCLAAVFFEQRFGFVFARLISRWRFKAPYLAHALPMALISASLLYSIDGIPNFIYFAF